MIFRGKVPLKKSTNIKKHVFSQLFNTQISPSGICTFRACTNHDFRLYFDDVLTCFCLLGAMLMPQNRVQVVQDAKVYTLLICSKTIRSEERFLCSGRLEIFRESRNAIGPPPSTGNRLAPTLTGSLSPTGRATAVRCLLLFCLMGRRGPKTRTGNSLAPILTN